MKNANGFQGENERQWKKKSEPEHRHFLHKTCNYRNLKKFHFLVVQNNGKEMYKKCAARAKLFFG